MLLGTQTLANGSRFLLPTRLAILPPFAAWSGLGSTPWLVLISFFGARGCLPLGGDVKERNPG